MMEDTTNAVRPQQTMPDTAFTQALADEIAGVIRPEPTSYGDWEKN